MACIDVPTIPVPTLPAGFSIPALPAPPAIQAGVCCQSVSLAVVPPPLPIGPLNPAFLLAVKEAIRTFQTFVDNLVPDCPRNS